MRKSYLNLTDEQKKRGVIFSSSLSHWKDTDGDTIHEITADESREEQELKRERLFDDKFFNNSHWKFNVIRR